MYLPQASVIITSYNQSTTLNLLLASLERQTLQTREPGSSAFEVIIADDGSSDNTAQLCQRDWGFPLQFVTQEDRGYRKSRILNQAIRHAKSDYLVFLDGDVILEKHFLQDHLDLRTPGYLVCGRRVDLGPILSQQLTLEHIVQGKFDGLNLNLILSGLQKDSTYVKRGVRVSSRWLRKILGYDRPIDLLGSNFSIWKADILAVNAFNESLESYWGEDGDLFIRLRNSGKKVIGAKALCIQYHVFHPRRPPTQANVELYQKLLGDKDYKWAAKGYSESSGSRD